MRNVLCVCVACLILLCMQSCQDDPVTLQFNLKPGARYAYTITTRQALEPEGIGANFIINQDMVLEYTFKVLTDSANMKRITVMYDRIAIKSGNGMQVWQYDSGDSTRQGDSIFRYMGHFLQKPFNILVTPGGEIVKQVKVASAINFADTNLTAGTENRVHEFSDSSLQSLLLLALRIYPAGAVKSGNTWKQVFNATMGFLNMKFDNTYTLTSVSSGIAHIDVSSNISSNMAKGVNMDIRGLQTGTLDVEVKTGLVTVSKCTQKIKSEMKLNNKTIPLNVQSETEIKGGEL